jgi:hypothetical protein
VPRIPSEATDQRLPALVAPTTMWEIENNGVEVAKNLARSNQVNGVCR